MLNVFAEMRLSLYNFFTIYVSSAALLFYNLAHFRKKEAIPCAFSLALLQRCKNHPILSRLLSWILTAIEIVLISLFQHGLVSVLNTILGNVLQTGTNYFGMIFGMPFLLALYCWLLGIDPFRQIDLITPAYPLALFFMKIGCFCVGCCRGMPFAFGMHNYRTGETEFPIQLVEAAVALFLFIFFHFYRKKARPGTLLPIYIVLYSSIRFFSEFLRTEPAVLGPLKVYHFLCLLGILFGYWQLHCLNKHREKVISLFDRNFPAYLRKKASRRHTHK